VSSTIAEPARRRRAPAEESSGGRPHRAGLLRQTAAFARKELAEVVRQPRLLLLLALGPFLILLLFASGYRRTLPQMEVLLVVPAGSPFAGETDEATRLLRDEMHFAGVVEDEAEGVRALTEGEVDLVIIVPADPISDVREGRRSQIRVLHTQLDPVVSQGLSFAASLAVEELNTQVLAGGLGEAQEAAGRISQSLARGGTRALSDPLGASAVGEVEDLSQVDPAVIARPFEGVVEISGAQLRTITDYYAPSAVAVLLQHLGISFGALTMVRERELGFDTIFAIAPSRPLGLVVGKLFSYTLLGVGLSAILIATLRYVLGVPVLGSPVAVALVLLLVVFASACIGLLVSLVSKSDAQAVQIAMLLLLASLFFTGFFLPLEQLEQATRPLSWLLPATHGIELLRSVMLQGETPGWAPLSWLAGLTLGAFVLSWHLTRRRLVVRAA
jgi:ABC-2 type transport system permease protein